MRYQVWEGKGAMRMSSSTRTKSLSFTVPYHDLLLLVEREYFVERSMNQVTGLYYSVRVQYRTISCFCSTPRALVHSTHSLPPYSTYEYSYRNLL